MFGIRDINLKKYKTVINYLGESTINQNNNENTPATDSPELEQKKKLIETKIELALKDNDFILAKELCEELEKQVKLLRS